MKHRKLFLVAGIVVVALVSPTDTDSTENWMASGVAVLLIAAFSPIVIFSALRFAHGQAGSAARNGTNAWRRIAAAPPPNKTSTWWS